MVLDAPLLYEDLTVRQHLELVADAHGAGGDGLAERIEAELQRWSLTDRADFVPHELSRRMRQKAQLACAALPPFRVLVLDEPVVGDSAALDTLAELFEETKAAGEAVLVSTHQPGFAERVAGRTLQLENGRIVGTR